jgi:hypothetical protein
MDIGNTFGFDKELADAGVWISIDGNGARIKVAALPNSKWDRHIEVLARRYREMEKEIPETSYEEALASDILLEWESIEDEGKPIDPTVENRLAMIRKYPAFKAFVVRESRLRANFQREREAAEAKNSVTGSTTSSGSAQS